jgi:hypothetical protein
MFMRAHRKASRAPGPALVLTNHSMRTQHDAQCITRHTPKDIAEERERFQELLEEQHSLSIETREKMRDYVRELESQLAGLPGEVEAGLAPEEITKMLGESLRQNFIHSGLPDTAQALRATSVELAKAQQQLSNTMRILADGHDGIVKQVESSNRRIEYSIENRATRLDALVHEWKMDLARIWIPMIALAALLLGMFGGMQIQGCQDSASPGEPAQLAAPVVTTPLPKANTGTEQNPNQQTGHSSTTHGSRPRSSRTPGR